MLYYDELPNIQPKNTSKYRRVKWCIYTVVILLMCIGIYYLLQWLFDWEYRYAVFVLMLYPIYKLMLGIYLSYHYTRYGLNFATLEISKGAYFMHRKILPIDLMQSVKIEQGFIMKRFNLARVTVFTRGESMELPYMSYEEAEIVAQKIISRIKEIHYE